MAWTAQQLQDILQTGESFCVEFKQEISASSRKSIGETICAFANDITNADRTGHLFIGVDDNGIPCKLTDERAVDAIHDMLKNGDILPPPRYEPTLLTLNGIQICHIAIIPSSLPPIRYKGTVYVRSDASNRVANREQERILTEKASRSGGTWDVHPAFDSTLDDMDMGLFQAYLRLAVSAETLAENGRTDEMKLKALRLYHLRENCLTNLAILLFGTNPRYWIPGDYIQYNLYPGTDETDIPLDNVEISGDLPSMIREIEAHFSSIITTESREEGMRLLQTPSWPKEAIKEILLNALIHRDYTSNSPVRFYVFQDRIEIRSPGGIFGGIPFEEIENNNVTEYRNPALATAFKEYGYVQRFGMGLKRARQRMRDNGNPDMTFSITSSIFSVTLPKRVRNT